MARISFQQGLWLSIEVCAGLAVAAVIALFIVSNVHRSPALKLGRAVALISEQPEFSDKAKLVKVTHLRRGAASLKDCCYSAAITVVRRGTRDSIKGDVWFEYYAGAWHIDTISFGQEFIQAH